LIGVNASAASKRLLKKLFIDDAYNTNTIPDGNPLLVGIHFDLTQIIELVSYRDTTFKVRVQRKLRNYIGLGPIDQVIATAVINGLFESFFHLVIGKGNFVTIFPNCLTK
jgi:hypothetical protein